MLKSSPVAPGPERPTHIERALGLTHLPYSISCIIVGCLLGAPGFFILYWADSLSLAQAFRQLTSSAFFTIGRFGQPMPQDQGLAVAVLYTVFLILTMYSIRYMRTISQSVESSITRLNSEYSEKDYHRMFGDISNLKFIALLTLGFTLVYAPSRIVSATGVFSLVSSVVLLPLDFFVVSAALWVYLRSLWGVYRFGSGKLELLPFQTDRMLGLHPMGVLSLSFGIVYLILDSLALAAGFLTADVPNLLVLFGLLVLLAAMLFLPLYGIHRKMLAEKRRQKADLHSKITAIAAAADDRSTESDEENLSDLKYLLAYRVLTGEVAKMPTWPFDTGRLERFLAVFLSVTAIIIARLIQLAFHF